MKEFDSWTEFITWKQAEETNNYCQFVKPTGLKSVGSKYPL